MATNSAPAAPPSCVAASAAGPTAPPTKKARITSPETDTTGNVIWSTAKHDIMFEYSFADRFNVTSHLWACEECHAEFMLLTTTDSVRERLGIFEVGSHMGHRRSFGHGGQCSKCEVWWRR